MDLAEAIYEETERLPSLEKYGLLSQMRRAAVSVPANIAEGHARESRPDYIRCLRIARGSLGELYTHYLLAVRVRVMPSIPQLEDLIKEEARILQALIRSLEHLSAARKDAQDA
jgi:four helix bundle protein